MYKRLFSLAVLCCLFTTLALAQKIETDWDRTANFSTFHTYAWEQSPHPAKGFWNDRIIDGIDKALQAKGLTKIDASANPDMWVVYSNSIKDQKQVVGTGYNMGPGWYWGGWGGPSSVTYNTTSPKKGRWWSSSPTPRTNSCCGAAQPPTRSPTTATRTSTT